MMLRMLSDFALDRKRRYLGELVEVKDMHVVSGLLARGIAAPAARPHWEGPRPRRVWVRDWKR